MSNFFVQNSFIAPAILVALLAHPLTALADIDSEELSKNTAEISKPKRFLVEGGIEYRNFSYEEKIDKPGARSKEVGNMAGYVVRGTYYTEDAPLFFQGSYSGTSGTLTYDGTSQDTKRNYRFDGPHKFSSLEGLMGISLLGTPEDPSNVQSELWIYGGLGVRTWSRGDDSTHDGVKGFNETYTWANLPLGIKTSFKLGERFHIGADVSYRPVLGGTMRAQLSQLDEGLDDVSLTLGKSSGWKAELPMRADLGKVSKSADIYVALSPYYERYGFGKSDTKPMTSGGKQVVTKDGAVGILEPESHTVQMGVVTSVGLLF